MKGFISTIMAAEIVSKGSPKDIEAVVNEYELSYPLLVAALVRKDISEAVKGKIRQDIKTIYARVYPEE